MSESQELTVYKDSNELPPSEGGGSNILDSLKGLVNSIGTLELTESQRAILFAPPNDNEIEIRPDGLVYLPWPRYAIRLREAFGLEWGMLPDGKPQRNGDLILWGFFLIIKGKLTGYAIGEQKFQSTNKTMSWGDTCEGAKSNALMRLCKGLGMTLDLWLPGFGARWKEEFATTYFDKRLGKLVWIRRDRKPKE